MIKSEWKLLCLKNENGKSMLNKHKNCYTVTLFKLNYHSILHCTLLLLSKIYEYIELRVSIVTLLVRVSLAINYIPVWETWSTRKKPRGTHAKMSRKKNKCTRTSNHLWRSIYIRSSSRVQYLMSTLYTEISWILYRNNFAHSLSVTFLCI